MRIQPVKAFCSNPAVEYGKSIRLPTVHPWMLMRPKEVNTLNVIHPQLILEENDDLDLEEVAYSF